MILILGRSNKSCTTCIKHLDKIYIIYEKTGMTWFDAKQYCTKQNMSFASFSQGIISVIIGLLSPVFRRWKNKSAWIGLRLTEYYIHQNNGNLY